MSKGNFLSTLLGGKQIEVSNVNAHENECTSPTTTASCVLELTAQVLAGIRGCAPNKWSKAPNHSFILPSFSDLHMAMQRRRVSYFVAKKLQKLHWIGTIKKMVL